MAKAVGISPDSVHRIWRANDMKPFQRPASFEGSPIRLRIWVRNVAWGECAPEPTTQGQSITLFAWTASGPPNPATPVEWLRFADRAPKQLELHLIDNYGTHKHEKAGSGWGGAPPQIPHLIHGPVRRLNLVERFFGLTQDDLRDGRQRPW